MSKQINVTLMSDSELVQRFRETHTELCRSYETCKQAELQHVSSPSSASLGLLKAARRALLQAPRTDPFTYEILCRLNFPLKAARLARGLTEVRSPSARAYREKRFSASSQANTLRTFRRVCACGARFAWSCQWGGNCSIHQRNDGRNDCPLRQPVHRASDHGPGSYTLGPLPADS